MTEEHDWNWWLDKCDALQAQLANAPKPTPQSKLARAQAYAAAVRERKGMQVKRLTIKAGATDKEAR